MRKRSRYRPREILTDPLTLMRPATKEQKDAVLGCFLSALETMVRGESPSEDDWRALSDAINTVEVLALRMEKLVPQEVMPVINRAIAAMVGAANRFKAGHRMGLDGEGIQALRDVIDIYRQCLDGLTSREMSVAQQLTQQRVTQLLRSKKTSTEVVAV